MKRIPETHTITIVIPTRALAYAAAGLLAGLVIGTALAACVVCGVDVWAPMIGLPALATVSSVPAASAAPVAPDDVLDVDPGELAALGVSHPAVIAFTRVPRPVRRELDALVDRVLAAKYAGAA